MRSNTLTRVSNNPGAVQLNAVSVVLGIVLASPAAPFKVYSSHRSSRQSLFESHFLISVVVPVGDTGNTRDSLS